MLTFSLSFGKLWIFLLHFYSKSHFTSLYPTGADDLSKQDFSKELGNAMAQVHEMFGDAELLPSDEALRDGLGDPLDFNELQMLTDSSLVTDPATEDSFRLDRL